MLPSFPKIFQLGTPYIPHIFNGPVEITEKLDGSQFTFGVTEEGLEFRSKRARINPEQAPNLFVKSVEHILKVQDKLPLGYIFHGEAFHKEKHNSLKYGRVPFNNIALFAVKNPDGSFDIDWWKWANILEIEPVNIFYPDIILDERIPETIERLLLLTSQLGDVNPEGVVVKNYSQTLEHNGISYPICCGKYVSEKFKETNNKEWGEIVDPVQALIDSYKTEARWEKAVQSFKEIGEYIPGPKNIGPLLGYIAEDIKEECKIEIMEKLWNIYKRRIISNSTRGFPEWYKRKLLGEIQ